MSKICLFVALLGLLHSALCNTQFIEIDGPCPTNVPVVQNFNAEAYLGRWHDVARYPTPRQPGQCNRAVYSQGTDGLINLVNSQVVNQKLATRSGTARLVTPNQGHLKVNIAGTSPPETDLYILATDYNEYSLVYSCSSIPNTQRSQVISWKLSRNRQLSSAANDAINSYIASSPLLNANSYIPTSQSQADCFHIPEVSQGQDVQLIGSCDGIVGQAGFDINSYAGWWHQISSYPSSHINGQCLSSMYRQENNQFYFEDVQVSGGSAQIIRGSVVVSSNGKLTKSWMEGEVARTQDIWVLATDYVSYSVVVSCEVVDSETVRVWSSQQSKSRSLSQSAVAAIAQTVAGNSLLDNSLYLTVDQSNQACSYLPPADIEQPVVLPGQCDPDIPVQENFTMQDYGGTWYQIERYPYPEVASNASCVGTRYDVMQCACGRIWLRNWFVNGAGDLEEIRGEVNVTDSTLRIFYDGSEDVAELHILSTDYVSYSLAYTCENINSYQKVVVAFKLSRTRQLSDIANAAINSYMADRQEFQQKYFIHVEHNEDCVDPSSSFLVKSSVFIVLICSIINMLA